MVHGVWGKKIGMTQLFSDKDAVVPVTVIDVSDWYVTQIKTVEKDGYDAVQLGHVRKKYADQEFSADWLKKPATYFSACKEVPFSPQEQQDVQVGNKADVIFGLEKGDHVDVFGVSKGAGFQGVVKRHGFSGGPASHGATFGRFPGALSHQTACGRVSKGKKMPGHMGVKRMAMKNLEVIDIEPDARVVLVKGSVPGKTGSLVFVRKV